MRYIYSVMKTSSLAAGILLYVLLQFAILIFCFRIIDILMTSKSSGLAHSISGLVLPGQGAIFYFNQLYPQAYVKCVTETVQPEYIGAFKRITEQVMFVFSRLSHIETKVSSDLKGERKSLH